MDRALLFWLPVVGALASLALGVLMATGWPRMTMGHNRDPKTDRFIGAFLIVAGAANFILTIAKG